MASKILADNAPDPNSVTTKLSEWVSNVTLDDIPENIKERAKYLILDGLGCALVGAHLPWSEEAVEAITKFETPGGTAPIIGWKGKKTGLISSAIINSSFIQGFELDDYHSYAPLHSNSIILPTLISLLSREPEKFTGKDLLLATIVGYEVGPRVGRSIGGSSILSVGWHSGAVFGPPVASASAAKLLNLNARQVEDAFGMACTQAAGLMSAQFESSVKRMQHGFAARNGLFAALMAESNYKGISKVFERKYGGYIPVFTLGGLKPKPEEIALGLGEIWRTEGVLVKIHACMGGIHSTCESVGNLLKDHDIKYQDIEKVTIELTEAPFHHGGWKAEAPIQVIGAQMNNAYIAATIFIDGSLEMKSFDESKLNRPEVWDLVSKIECKQNNFEGEVDPQFKLCTQITVELKNGEKFTNRVVNPKGVLVPFSKDDIVGKFRHLTNGIISTEEQERIIESVVNLENTSIEEFLKVLDLDVKSPFAV
ncbi:uncharacterized protein RJT21DRAFT_119838 [Scheffersomyces amazonensis]|uniref:uncharacterized protein n=1 Tax=Scheffersomyces amazonensis TaxID=1078765 RepID=UPI00315C5F00